MFATDVWQRPGDGALLAQADMVAAPANLADALELWQSVDLGAHWTHVPTPTNLIPISGYLVAQPQANTPWRVCGIAQLGHGMTETNLIGCTLDGGQTWQSRPLPALPTPCGKNCPVGEVLADAAILPDGSLLGEFSGVLYLLAPHTTQWMDIGPSPDNGTFVCGAPTVTVFSVGNARTLLGDPFGSILGSGGNPDAREIAVATLT